MKYQTYPAYKDSGVEWFGKVPEHWYPLRFKYVISEKKKTSNANLDAGSISFGKVIYKNNENLSTETKDSYQEVLAGEFLINPLNLNYDLLSLRTALSTINVVVSTGYIVLLCEQRLVKNYVRWLLYQFDVAHMKTLGAGVRQTINFSDIGNSFFLEPSPEEQQKIAQFLDHETAKIDTLIEKQQRLIELLKEKRQAVISHAVTKGLNPNAPMKDSGVEWLGEVPEGWEIGCLKRFADIIDCKHFTVKFIDDGLPIVSIREVRDDKIDLSNANMTSENEWNFLREGRIPKLGDLIFCRNASVGAVGYVDFDTPFCMGQDVCLIRPGIASRYIHYQLTSVLIRNQIEAFLIGATIRRANVEEIRNLFVIYPPEDEQHLITDFLNRKTAKMDALILKAQNAIELMQERRTALISAAVTGKIDVREWSEKQ